MGTRVSQFSVVTKIADLRPEDQVKTFLRYIVFCLFHTSHTYTEVCPAACLLSVWGSVSGVRWLWGEVCSIVREYGRLEILASHSQGFS